MKKKRLKKLTKHHTDKAGRKQQQNKTKLKVPPNSLKRLSLQL